MKVTFDPDVCEANAVCARLVPQVFYIRGGDADDDLLVIANDGEIPAERAGGVRGAVTRCPKMALSVRE